MYSSKDNHLDDVDLNEELHFSNIPKLSFDEANSLEGLLTFQQASQTLTIMKNNRSPGSDGYGADFFKVFWNKIGHFVVKSINYGYEKGELSVTQKEGIITVIPKENKPRHF